MVGDKLIERKCDPADKRTLPYYLAQHGRAYLDEQRSRESLLRESGVAQRSDVTQENVHQAITAYLRALPEFHESSVRRVEEVSEAIGIILPRHQSVSGRSR